MAPTDREMINKQHLELITEVRALSIAVSGLHAVFVKRKVLFWAIGILAGLVLILGAAGGVLVYSQHRDVTHLVTRLQDSCQTRNKQANGTQRFLTREQKIQDDSQAFSAQILSQLHLTFTPEQLKLQKDLANRQTQALADWKKSQPKTVSCDLK